MKGKDDADTRESSVTSGLSAGKTGSIPDASSLSSFIQQEQMCKLYLSMGVHPSDIADTSDDDVASILEQMSRLHPSGQEPGVGDDRNIEDILQEAESLLDGQSVRAHSTQKSNSSRRCSGASDALHRLGSGKSNFNNQLLLESQGSLQQRQLSTMETMRSSAVDVDSDVKQIGDDSPSDEPLQQAFKALRQQGAFLPPHIVGTPLEVTYKRIYEQMRKEVDGTLKHHLTGDFPDFKLSLPIPGLDTPSFDVPGCFNLEQEFLEERRRCLKLKADLDWLKRQHEKEVAELRRRHEDQLNQVREELQTTVSQDPSMLILQNEIRAQERIITDYKQENEKMCTELKDIKRLLLKLMALLKADNDSVCILP